MRKLGVLVGLGESGNGKGMVWWAGLLMGYLSEDVYRIFIGESLRFRREVRVKFSIISIEWLKLLCGIIGGKWEGKCRNIELLGK